MTTQSPRFDGGFTGNPNTSILGGLTNDPTTNIFGVGNRWFNPPQDFSRVADRPPPPKPESRPRPNMPSRDIPTDENPVSTEMDLTDFTVDIPEYLGDWRENAAAFWQNRMDPSYTSFTPEARAAFDRDIGRQLATSQQAISNDMRGRGIGGSGIAAQMQLDASAAAAATAGDTLAQMAMYDETQRNRAANALDAMYRFGVGDVQFREGLAQEAAMSEAEALRLLSEGPDYEHIDPLEIFGGQQGLDQFQRGLLLAVEELRFTPAEAWGMLMDVLGGENLGLVAPWFKQAIFG